MNWCWPRVSAISRDIFPARNVLGHRQISGLNRRPPLITPRLRGSTSGCASWRQAPVSGLWEWSFVVSFWVVGASDSGLTPWRSNPGGGKSPLAIESIDNRYCQSPRGVMRSRPAQLALIYEWQRGLSQQYSPLLWKLYIPAIGKCRPALRSIRGKEPRRQFT